VKILEHNDPFEKYKVGTRWCPDPETWQEFYGDQFWRPQPPEFVTITRDTSEGILCYRVLPEGERPQWIGNRPCIPEIRGITDHTRCNGNIIFYRRARKRRVDSLCVEAFAWIFNRPWVKPTRVRRPRVQNENTEE